MEVILTLHFGVSRLVVDVEIAEQTDTAVGLNQAAARMRLEPLRNNGVLDSDVGNFSADREGLVATPRYGNMVEDHVLPLGDCYGVLARVAAFAHADTNVPHDGIVGIRPGQAVAVDSDTLNAYGEREGLTQGAGQTHAARCRLPCYVDIFGDTDATCDIDYAADIKDDDAVVFADGIAERPGARVSILVT